MRDRGIVMGKETCEVCGGEMWFHYSSNGDLIDYGCPCDYDAVDYIPGPKTPKKEWIIDHGPDWKGYEIDRHKHGESPF